MTEVGWTSLTGGEVRSKDCFDDALLSVRQEAKRNV